MSLMTLYHLDRQIKSCDVHDDLFFIVYAILHDCYCCYRRKNLINPLECFFGSEVHVAQDRNPGPGYDTLLLRMIPGDLLSACPHRQFHTLPGLLDSRAALSDSYPNALRQSVPFL